MGATYIRLLMLTVSHICSKKALNTLVFLSFKKWCGFLLSKIEKINFILIYQKKIIIFDPHCLMSKNFSLDNVY